MGPRTQDLWKDLSNRRAALRGLASLVELNLTAEDSAQLRAWARDTARPIEARNMKENFGLVFLAAATVIARDEAGEGTLWPHLVEVFGHGEGKVLVGPKLPHPDVRDAIEAATRVFGLRHALDRGADEQRWYLTILLQCGWTKPGISARLAFWLAGHPLPRSMALLLEDAERASESFREVFSNLLRFRRGESNSVPDSPWLAGGLHELAIGNARADLHLGTTTGGHAAACGVRLLAPSHQMPRFLLDPILPLDLVRDDRCARLSIRAGSCRTFAYRGSEGSYRSEGSLELPLLDDMAAECEVEISTDGGEVISREIVTLFGEEDIDLFVEIEESLYRRVPDAWTASAPVRRGILVRAADDLKIQGVFSRERRRMAGSFWQAVRADEVYQLRVWVRDVAWELPEDGKPRRQWPYPVTVKWVDDGSWIRDKSVSWRCDAGCAGAIIEKAWLGRQQLKVELGMERLAPTQLLVLEKPRNLPRSFRLRLQIRHDGPPYLKHHVAEPPYCTRPLRRGPDGLSTVSKMTWDELQHPMLYLGRMTGEQAGSQPYLFEGERAVAPLAPRETDISRKLAGLGGRVSVRTGRFNGETCGKAKPEDHVVNTGCIGQVECPSQDLLCICLTPHLEWPASETKLELMLPDGAVTCLDSALLESSAGAIKTIYDFQPAAVAVAFRDSFVGRWAGPAAEDAVRRACASPAGFFRTALWLLKRRFPVEGPVLKAVLEEFSRKHPVEALRICLDPDLPQDDYLAGAWRFVLSNSYVEMFDGLCATNNGTDGVGRLLAAEAATVPRCAQPVADLFKRIAGVDPMAAFLFLLVALVKRYHDRPDSDSRACVNDLYAWGDIRLIDTKPVSRRLDVDEGVFVGLLDRVVKGKLDPRTPDHDRNELLRYCYIPEFREALGRAFVRPVLKAAELAR